MNLKPRNARPGMISNVRTVGDMAQQLRPYFLPASFAQPPGASPSATGNRTITITNKTQRKPVAQDAATLALGAGGQLNWSFKTAFTAPPAVTATPQHTQGGPVGTGTLYVDSVASNGCVIKSTDPADRRIVHLQATQPSQGE